MSEKIRVFEAFAGMGAQHKALSNIDQNKDNYEIKGLAEWFIPAIVSYETIHNDLSLAKIDWKTPTHQIKDYLSKITLSADSKKPVDKKYWDRLSEGDLRLIYTAVKNSKQNGNIFDVRTLYERTLKDIDLLTYSFPCQDLSSQGKQKGMGRESNTRSGLLWEIEKALDSTKKEGQKLPKYLLMENVVALTHKVNKKDLAEWMNKLESLGYKNSIKILNATDFGSAQARRRVFMLSTLNELVELPNGDKKPKSINSILDKIEDEKNIMYNLKDYKLKPFTLTKSNIKKSNLLGYTTFNSESQVYDPKYSGPTLTASGANSRIKLFMNKQVDNSNRIRKLNACECYRYMGFDTKDFKKVNNLKYLEESKMIYTCGNSISVEVLESIMNVIIKNNKKWGER